MFGNLDNKFNFFGSAKPHALPFSPSNLNKSGELLPALGLPATQVVWTAPKDMKVAGGHFLKWFLLNTISDKNIEVFLKKYSTKKYSPKEIHAIVTAIKRVQINIVHDNAPRVNKDEVILTMTGDPLAIEIVQTAASSIIGIMSAVAEQGYQMQEAVKQNGIDNAIWAAFQARRDAGAWLPMVEYALANLGFKVANIETYFNSDVLKVFKFDENAGTLTPQEIGITGTIAHKYISQITATHKVAIEFDLQNQDKNGTQVKKFLQSIGLMNGPNDEVGYNKYIAVAKNPECDLHDYIAFCCIIKDTKELRDRANKSRQERGLAQLPARIVSCLVDTTSTMHGVRAAIQASVDCNKHLDSIRLDTSPADFLDEALDALIEAENKHPGLFTNTRVINTDGIDMTSLVKLTDIAARKKATSQYKALIGFGIGSSLALTNLDPVEFTKQQYPANHADKTVKPHPVLKTTNFTLEQVYQENEGTDTIEEEQRKFEKMEDTPPIDFYIFSMNELLDHRNRKFKAFDLPVVIKEASAIHFRSGKAGEFMVISGTDKIKAMAENFAFDQDFTNWLVSNKSGLDYTPEDIEALRVSLKEHPMIVRAVPEGYIAQPYEPLVWVEGKHAELLEAYFLATLGYASQISTNAHKVREDLRWSDELPICAYIGMNKLIIDDNVEKALANVGFKALPSSALEPLTFLIDLSLIKDLNQEKLTQLINDLDLQKNPELKILLRGNFDAAVVKIVKDTLRVANIPAKNIEFQIDQPISNTRNPKGIVEKGSAIWMQYADQEQTIVAQRMIKAGSAKPGQPGEKTSLTGTHLQAVVLELENPDTSISYTKLIIDLDLLPNAQCTLENVKQYLQDNKPVIYYDQTDKTIAKATQLGDNVTIRSVKLMLSANKTRNGFANYQSGLANNFISAKVYMESTLLGKMRQMLTPTELIGKWLGLVETPASSVKKRLNVTWGDIGVNNNNNKNGNNKIASDSIASVQGPVTGYFN